MNDIRRTILWVIFGFSMVLLWDKWQVFNGHKATFFPTPVEQAAVAKPAQSAASSLPASVAVPPAAGVAQVPVDSAALPVTKEPVVITTDLLKLTFNTEGGSLVRSELLGQVDMADKSKNFVLLDDSKDRYYAAQTGLIAGVGTVASGALPSHKTVMSLVPGERTLAEGAKELVLRFESPVVGGVKLVKTYSLTRGSYVIHVKHEVQNVGTVAVSPQLYLQLVRDGNKPPGESSFYSTFTGPAVYTDAKKYQKVEFKTIEENKVDIEKTATSGYVTMVQHYFASAWLLGDGIQRELFMRKVDTNLYAVGMITPMNDIAPGTSKTVDARMFVGPQLEKLLESLTPGLELVKDYGWVKILAEPLYWLLDKIHGFLLNWGWSIVALVLLLKIAFYWLNAKAYSSMAKMKAIGPRITEMRERLKDKPAEMQQAMMKIYREEKINPMGGCFPIMVQIPVFMAL